jgi:hypothetical protein
MVQGKPNLFSIARSVPSTSNKIPYDVQYFFYDDAHTILSWSCCCTCIIALVHMCQNDSIATLDTKLPSSHAAALTILFQTVEKVPPSCFLSAKRV